jgi:penicillin-binding protein 1A
MMQLLQAVVRQGTGAAASQLKHPFGGKTGTTNDYTDAWFIGFSPSVTCGTWIGYDDRQSLGEKETGAHAALPMWMDFMRAAIANKPNEAFATAGAPKKTLDVPLSTAENGAKSLQQAPSKSVDADEDPDAPAQSSPKPDLPPTLAPGPAEKPTAYSPPHMATPAKVVSVGPAKPTTAPAKLPADDHSGVSKPPLDTN